MVHDRPPAGPGGGGKMCSGAWKRGLQSPVGVISLCIYNGSFSALDHLVNQNLTSVTGLMFSGMKESNRGRRNGRPIVWHAILALSDKWLSLDTRPMDKQIIIAQWALLTSDKYTSVFGQVLMPCYLSEGRMLLKFHGNLWSSMMWFHFCTHIYVSSCPKFTNTSHINVCL